MPKVPLAALRAQLAAGAPDRLYMLTGEDAVEKAAVADEFVALIDEDLRAFNVDRLRGGEVKVDALLDSASQFPMMASRRVIVVFEAEKLLVPKRESKAAEAEQDRLTAWFADTPPHAVVVFVCGQLDERRKGVKRLREQAAVVDCGTIANEAEAELWVKARMGGPGPALDPEAVRALVQRSGNDIGRLRSGLERVKLYALGQVRVSAQDVRDAVPAAPETEENFGVSNAIGEGDAAGALRQVGLALDAGAVPVMVMGQIRSAAERIPAAKLGAAMEAVLRTDLALKGFGSAEPRVLLERLVVELCGLSGGARRSGAGGRGWTPGYRPRR